jgi:hypothetical protein
MVACPPAGHEKEKNVPDPDAKKYQPLDQIQCCQAAYGFGYSWLDRTGHHPPVHLLPKKKEPSKVSWGGLQPAQPLKRFRAGFYRIHQEKHVLRVLLVLYALAEREDSHREFIG